LFLTSSNSKNGPNSLQNMNSNDLQVLSDETEIEAETGIDDDDDDNDNDNDNDNVKYNNKNNKKVEKQRRSTIQQFRDNLNVGDALDAQDVSGLWWTAKIKAVRDDGQVQISFDEWGETFDEWLPRDSDRLEMPYTRYIKKSNDKKIIKEGAMQNEGKMYKTWRKRHFVLLDDGQLVYYGNQGDDNALGSIKIRGFKNIVKMSYGKTKQFGFEIETDDNRVCKFLCEEEKDQIEWIKTIKSFQSEKSTK